MQKSITSHLTAQKLRLILIGGIVLLIAIATILFIFAKDTITSYAADVKQVTTLAELSSKNLATLSQLKTTLSENTEAVERTKSLVAESKSYGYQDQIIKDINLFAEKSGVEVSGYQFSDNSVSGGAPAANTSSGGVVDTPSATGDLKTTSVSVTLKSPLEYKDIMNFVHMIEQSLTKMQLAGISMATDTSDTGKVTVSSLTLEVYVR
ncbi:MAG: hypothetical protein WAS27_01045 [Candidatus Saccharimonadales bacterium]